MNGREGGQHAFNPVATGVMEGAVGGEVIAIARAAEVGGGHRGVRGLAHGVIECQGDAPVTANAAVGRGPAIAGSADVVAGDAVGVAGATISVVGVVSGVPAHVPVIATQASVVPVRVNSRGAPNCHDRNEACRDRRAECRARARGAIAGVAIYAAARAFSSPRRCML